MYKKVNLILLLMTLSSIIGFAQLSLSKLLADHMMIQRNIEVPIWGWANPGEVVNVQFRNETYMTTAEANRRWEVRLKAMPAGGPYEMKISTATENRRIKDILIGDIWLCSGQSNMEWLVRNSNHAEQEMEMAQDSKIRHFKIPQSSSESPADQLVGGEWAVCSPSTVGEFTAVGYFFARELRKNIDVPIGLINSSWGGSRIEPWMSADALGYTNPEAAIKEIQQQQAMEEEKRRKKLIDKIGHLPKSDEGMAGEKALWANPDFNDQDWSAMDLPQIWEAAGLDGLDGIVWFRKGIQLTAEEAQQPIQLHLGPIDDSDICWINGHKIGGLEMAWNTDRQYEARANQLIAGLNIITVRVEDTGGGGGIYGQTEKFFIKTSKRKIPLQGAWRYKVGKVDLAGGFNVNQVPTMLYHKMIHPILGFPIKGALWYQGESNANGENAVKYAQQFPTMIQDWRKRWACGNFPFLFVQLANWLPVDEVPSNSDWAILRESQSKTLATSNTAQAVIIDIGDTEDIHPRNKQDVGLRLSLAARKLAYGEELVYSGPVYRSMRIDGHTIRLQFDLMGSQLLAKDPYGYLKAFAIAGADQKFVWAKARIEGNEIVVWQEGIDQPVAVRYAWGNNPIDANLYNEEGLPASPFRTDDW